MDLKKLTEDLNGNDEADRLYAAEDLGVANDSAAVGALTARLSVELSRAVKEAIFHALAKIRGESVMRAAIVLVESEDAFVRNEAVRLLGTFGEEAIPALAQATVSDDSDVRKFALDAMSTIDSSLKDQIYRKALGDLDINVVITVVEHIGRESKTALRESVEAVLERASHPMLVSACVAALSQIGTAGSLNAMYRKLGSDSISEFQVAGFIRALGTLGTDTHVELLCSLVERFPATLVDSGFDAIEAIRSRVSLPKVSPALLEAVESIVAKSSDPLGRYKAVRTLGAFTDEVTRASIRQYLQSPDKMVRLAAVESVARWGDQAGKELLAAHKAIETDEDVLTAIEDTVNPKLRNAA